MKYLILSIVVVFSLNACSPKTTQIEGCYCADKIGKDTLVFVDSTTVIRNGEKFSYEFFVKNKFTIKDEFSAIFKYRPGKDKIVTWFGHIRPVRIVYKRCKNK